MRQVLTYTLGTMALYAMVASCSATLSSPERPASLAQLAGDWQVVEASPATLQGRQVRIARDGLSLESPCLADGVRATLDRRGRVRVDAPAMAAVQACGRDGDGLAVVAEGADFIRIDSRTFELRNGRDRLRIRKA